MNDNAKLDRIDLHILAQLQEQGRMTNDELANAVSLSPASCLARVGRLEQAGYIAGYGARLDLRAFDDVQTVFAEITLTDRRREDFAKFEAAIGAVEEIVECHLASGEYDYLLKFITRSVSHYHRVIEALIARDIGIDRHFSYVIVRTPLVRTGYPLESLFPQPPA
ncbi:Lrp/AsnC family transcriptional regulator [Caballeronia sp. Lep1P3]|uniref:Lrp/AsnC family transcriptional regulator n=1 Tax=Caballeronia sp. Lep1P3 TaxID=2878150 RepID=UPI001FD151F3|nr:Lrp/AsnC family transcriptional regulator [Caballeronia sp. Lep1P3]